MMLASLGFLVKTQDVPHLQNFLSLLGCMNTGLILHQEYPCLHDSWCPKSFHALHPCPF